MKILHQCVVQVLEEVGTEGSSPLKVLTENGDVYFLKTARQQVPKSELINEVICHGLCVSWGLRVPSIAILSISKEVIESFKDSGISFSDQYNDKSLNGEGFYFGSKQVPNAVEMERNTKVENKQAFNKYAHPLDLIKIATFDAWIGNKDRKPKNPNVLLYQKGTRLDFCPIDHCAAFAYLQEYKKVTSSRLWLGNEFSLMKSHLFTTFIKFVDKKELQNYHLELERCFGTAKNQMQEIFDSVPKSWGFSAKSKAHLIKFLSDEKRNKDIAKQYFDYIR